MSSRFLAEWERQEGVILAFPEEQTDWQPYLDEARQCVVNIATAIGRFEKVYLLCRDTSECASHFETLDNITFIEARYDDTWMRDCMALSCQEDNQQVYKGFEFTGWGGKFDAHRDNALNKYLADLGIFKPYRAVDYILEGGAIESDGKGTILTTASCLLNPNRNEKHDQKSVEQVLKQELGAKRVLWLFHGHLMGDDTDGHIDTLARLCDAHTIAYVGLPPEDDEHYETFVAMEQELKAFRDFEGNLYKLIPLPFVPAIYHDGERLPATYANFLIINGAVLVPTYGVATDAKALELLADVFPKHQVIGIDCQVLIKQHGSLHCMTMQLSKV